MTPLETAGPRAFVTEAAALGRRAGYFQKALFPPLPSNKRYFLTCPPKTSFASPPPQLPLFSLFCTPCTHRSSNSQVCMEWCCLPSWIWGSIYTCLPNASWVIQIPFGFLELQDTLALWKCVFNLLQSEEQVVRDAATETVTTAMSQENTCQSTGTVFWSFGPLRHGWIHFPI